MDYRSLNDSQFGVFGVFVDSYPGLPVVIMGTTGFDVTKFLAKMCEDYRVPVSCTSDRGPNLTAKVVEDMMEDYRIHHRISSVENPHENARAELGVKTVKRILMDSVSAKGILDTDRAMVTGALLQLRNTQDRDSKLSSAKALYGRELRDFLPRAGSALMGDMWMNLVDARETAQARRAKNSEKKWSEHTRALAPLKVGQTVMNRDSKLSPAKALHGRELRDFLPRPGSALMGDMCMNLVDVREMAQARRAKHSEKKWSEHTRALAPLKLGHTVMDGDSKLSPAKALHG